MAGRARTTKEGSRRMPRKSGIVGLEVSKPKIYACIRSVELPRSFASTPEGEAAQAAAVIRTVRAEISTLDGVFAAKIRRNAVWARRATIIESVPGVADQTVASLVAWLPELGHVNTEAVAALVGVAPYDDDSG